MRVWHSASAMQRLAGSLLLLAMVGIAVTYVANQRSVAIQGPGALQAVSPDTLWLGVDEELWVLDREGRRTARRTARELGLSKAVSNIVPGAPGQVLLTSRGDADWQVVDAATLAPLRTIRPRWPADLAGNYRRAIHLAVAPDGSVAVATGGGHAVLLFDADGGLQARTAPSTYHFTNGLWWSPDGWWTTDTNRFVLRLLDARTLAVKASLPLAPAPAGYPFLSEARPSQGNVRPGTQLAPLATVTRVGALMEPGHAVDVFPDGSQAVFNHAPFPQLRDITWFDARLLLVDGGSFTLQRYGPDRIADGEFGDAAVRSELQRRRADREFWRTLGSRYALLASALLLVAGIAAYARHKRLAARDRIAAREGGKAAEQAAPLRQRGRLHAIPFAVRLVVLALSLFIVFPLLHLALLGPRPDAGWRSVHLMLATVIGLDLLVTLWQHLRRLRLRADPAYEAALNHRAIEWLRSHDDFDRVRLDGEVARESVLIEGSRPRWLVVTNRRVLLFLASARERRLASEWPRRAVVFAGPPQLLPQYAGSRWRRVLASRRNLAISFTSGTTLALRCASDVTATRVAQLLMASPALPGEDDVADHVARPGVRRRWREVFASLVLPGAGQWLQGRFTTGAVLFTGGVLLAVFLCGPVLWALNGPKMDVSAATIALAVGGWLVLALVAGGDAWRFSAARRPHAA